jgi:TM2 domain-containing membrane protein YozV
MLAGIGGDERWVLIFYNCWTGIGVLLGPIQWVDYPIVGEVVVE